MVQIQHNGRLFKVSVPNGVALGQLFTVQLPMDVQDAPASPRRPSLEIGQAVSSGNGII